MNTIGSRLSEFNQKADTGWRSAMSRVLPTGSTRRMLMLLAIGFAFFAILRPEIFLNPVNLQNIALSSPEIGVLAIAMMLAMATGGIDLSIVAIANISAISMSTMYTALAATDPANADAMMPIIVLVGVAVGGVAGLINSYLIAGIGITPILATLGTMQIFNGIAVAWTGGKTLYGAPVGLTNFGTATIAGVPALFIVFLLVAVAVGLMMTRSKMGMEILLQGANPLAAKFSGISVKSVLTSTYFITGLLAGIAGVLFLARNPTASADYGASYQLLAIVIAVLGGTNPNGGFATVLGVVLATLTLQVVSSGFTALRLTPYDYSMAQGLILIGVMVIDKVQWKWPKFRKQPSPQPTSNAVK